ACVYEEDGKPVIDVVTMHPWLRLLFPRAKRGKAAAGLSDHPALCFNGGSDKAVVVDVPIPGASKTRGWSQRCVIRCERVYRSGNAHFVTIEPRGPERSSASTTVGRA
ncbi:unnamed protein product, partial [marine sediment metagenome]